MSKTKQDLALGLGMKFDEVANIFGEETLSSMTMNHVVGGDTVNNCNGGHCGNCVAGCGTKASDCGTKVVCVSVSISASVSVSGSAI